MSENNKTTTKKNSSNDNPPSLGGRGTSTVKRDYSSNKEKPKINPAPPSKKSVK